MTKLTEIDQEYCYAYLGKYFKNYPHLYEFQKLVADGYRNDAIEALEEFGASENEDRNDGSVSLYLTACQTLEDQFPQNWIPKAVEAIIDSLDSYGIEIDPDRDDYLEIKLEIADDILRRMMPGDFGRIPKIRDQVAKHFVAEYE